MSVLMCSKLLPFAMKRHHRLHAYLLCIIAFTGLFQLLLCAWRADAERQQSSPQLGLAFAGSTSDCVGRMLRGSKSECGRYLRAPGLAAGDGGSSRAGSATDVIVIGSGIAGLSAAAMLAMYGFKVRVFEAHDAAGGAAHEFERKVPGVGSFTFDSGPSLFSGMSSPSANPLRQVLDSVGESPEWLPYDSWQMYLPNDVLFQVGSGDADAFGEELARVSGNPEEVQYWKQLQAANQPMSDIIAAIPPIALRGDVGVLNVLGPYLSKINPLSGLKMVLSNTLPSSPFSNVFDAGQVPKDSLTAWFFDFLAFALQGLPASATQGAGVSFMIREFFAPGAVMDYPRGGSGALVDAFIRAIEKNGGEVHLSSPVREIVVNDSGRCTGVVLDRDGERVDANVAVLCNADVWTTASKLIPEAWRPKLGGSALDIPNVPMCPSFMHLHVGIKADGLDLQSLGVHHIISNDLKAPVDKVDNFIFISIPSAVDDTAAPAGYAAIHAYLPATEPYEEWAGMDRRSEEYKQKKIERAEPLWRAIERVIPDVRSRAVVDMIGTPLTHERFLRRHRGTYGTAYRAGESTHPAPASPIESLFCIGDGSFPGIGVPAVAGNGAGVANTIAPVEKHAALLERLRDANLLVPDRDWA